MDVLEFKMDLLEWVTKEKYFQEKELVRLMNSNHLYSYEEKLERVSEILGKISIINQKIGLINTYFENIGDKKTEEENDNSR